MKTIDPTYSFVPEAVGQDSDPDPDLPRALVYDQTTLRHLEAAFAQWSRPGSASEAVRIFTNAHHDALHEAFTAPLRNLFAGMLSFERSARIDLSADLFYFASEIEATDVIDLATNPTARDLLEATLARRPELVERIRAIAEEMRRRFKAEPYIESAVYDAGDTPLTLTVESPLSVKEFSGEYEAFVDYLVDRNWDYDPGFDTFVTLTPGDDE